MVKFHIDLDRWINHQGDAISNVVFSNCTDVSESVYQPFTQLTISNIDGFGRFIINVVQNGITYTYDELTFDEFVQGSKFTFSADVSVLYIDKVLTMINEQLIAVNQDGNTTLFVYNQNSENIVLNKTLTPVNIIDGMFNHSIAVKNINIDIVSFNFNFNYVYIPSLNRYYYVDSVEMISSDYTRLHLREDVLMSWKNLISSQTAFIDRCENSTFYDVNIEDSEIKTDYDKNVVVSNILPVATSSIFSENQSNEQYVLTVVRK